MIKACTRSQDPRLSTLAKIATLSTHLAAINSAFGCRVCFVNLAKCLKVYYGKSIIVKTNRNMKNVIFEIGFVICIKSMESGDNLSKIS